MKYPHLFVILSERARFLARESKDPYLEDVVQ